MDNVTETANGAERAKEQLLKAFDYLLIHGGSGHLEVNMKLLKRGQKEILIQCGRTYRFIADIAERKEEQDQ